MIILIIIFTASAFSLPGCSILTRDEQSIAEKKQEKENKKAAADYEKARKKYYKNQSNDTKKMMKQTKKQAAGYNKSRKRGLFSGTKCD